MQTGLRWRTINPFQVCPPSPLYYSFKNYMNKNNHYLFNSDSFRIEVLRCKILLKSYISQGLNPIILKEYFGTEVYNQANKEVLLWNMD